MDISDPFSPNYGKFKSRDDIGELTSNSDATERVTNFLLSNRITVLSTTRYGEYIRATAKVEIWEQIFNTPFFVVEQIGEEATYVRAMEYR